MWHCIDATHPGWDVPRAPPSAHLRPDPRLELCRQHLALKQLDEQDNALVPVCEPLADSEAVDDGVACMGCRGRKAVFYHVVYLS